MTLLGLGIGVGIGLIASLIIGAIVYVVKDGKGEKVSELPHPEEVAAAMTEHQKEEIIQNYGGMKVPFKFNENISGTISNLYVDYVVAYGVTYRTIVDAVDACDGIDDVLANEMECFDCALNLVRKERMDSRRYLHIKEMLDEVIYVYEPCKLKIDTDTRGEKASRIAIDMVRDENTLKMSIETIYVSLKDVTSKVDRYEFDMLNPDDAESFNLLVRTKGEFIEEIEELAKIESHLNRYNELVDKNRVGRDDNGEIVIYPPSPEEIRAKRAAEKKQVFGNNVPKEEKTEPKKQVDEEFVSTKVLNN